MNRRSACLLAVVAVLITLTTIGSEISHASTASKRSAHAKLSAQLGTPGPVSNIGFVSAPQIPAGGYDNATYFPPVSGDFNGDGNKDVATVVRTPGAVYQISVALGNGNGTFQAPVQTPPRRPLGLIPFGRAMWMATVKMTLLWATTVRAVRQRSSEYG